MAKTADLLTEELDRLRGVRDELRLKLKLGKAEARDGFEQLEQSWKRVERHVKSLANATRDDRAQIQEAARQLAREIRDGYRHLQRLL